MYVWTSELVHDIDTEMACGPKPPPCPECRGRRYVLKEVLKEGENLAISCFTCTATQESAGG